MKTSYEIGSLCEELQICVDKSISTLESNYYINMVCLSYSKLMCLDTLCLYLLKGHMKFAIKDYELGCQEYMNFSEKKNMKIYNLSDNYDQTLFFKLFNAFDRPLIYANVKYDLRRPRVRGLHTNKSIEIDELIYDYDKNVLKVEGLKHLSPPEYFVRAIEDVLKYLITSQREEEIRKIDKCLKYQEYMIKNIEIVEKVVNLNRMLNDERMNPRIKYYVLEEVNNTLNVQAKLHEMMGITPTIKHLDIRL